MNCLDWSKVAITKRRKRSQEEFGRFPEKRCEVMLVVKELQQF